jgi:copper(I)-binding protein
MTMNPSTHTMSRTLIAALAATSLLAACGSDNKSASTTADPASTEAAITVSDAWARTSATVATAGAVYMTITNAGGGDDALIAASVDPSVAETVELHESVAVGSDDLTAMTPATGMATETTAGAGMATDTTAGTDSAMMQMRPVDRIVAPANGSVALAPGGYHIMLVGLVQPLAVGTTVELSLTFEKSGDQVVIAAVRDSAP